MNRQSGCARSEIITAFRKEPSKERQLWNATQLGKTINAAGYGFIKMDGGYIEDPETDPTAVVEFFVFRSWSDTRKCR
jgi:hypothetical protein